MHMERITQQISTSQCVWDSPCLITNVSFSDTSGAGTGPSIMIYDSSDLSNLVNPIIECESLVKGTGTVVRDFNNSPFPFKNGIVVKITNATTTTSVIISFLPKYPKSETKELLRRTTDKLDRMIELLKEQNDRGAK